ncbi:hypothetical protein [Aquimarina algiphila]|uniref:hypothetical protein n=1 Tax=Aquimarina algiphila TaxID=2047982 RepID=UPI00249033BC|nr:hypothetical protein [Aquimarina algiphila]
MKLKIWSLLLLVIFYSCTTEENDLDESINPNSISFAEAIANLEDKTGVIIAENTVTFTEDLTIPENVILNFNVRDRMIINAGVTVTINGIISAGKFQIFEIAAGGKVNGCPQIEYVTPHWWGVDDTGTNPISDIFQTSIESFPCIKKFVASGSFLVNKEILLSVNGRHYDFNGSTFIGVTTGTDNGGLITIGGRDFSINDKHSVEDVTLIGGTYIPKFNHDNSLGILHAKNIKISNVTIKGENSLRGIAMQNPNSTISSNPAIENVIIENVIQTGGVNAINIDINNGIAKNIVVDNIIASSINEINPQAHILDKEASFRISSNGDHLRIKNLTISNVVLDDIYQGFELKGVKANISNVQIQNVEHIGINIQFPDVINLNDIEISGVSNQTNGIVGVGPSALLSNELNFSNIKINGTFKRGVWNSIGNIKFNRLAINGNFMYGIYNNAKKSIYKDINISSSTSTLDYTAIYNAISGMDSNFSGTINGKYEYGIINAAKNSIMDFQINGSFSNAAVFTFFNGNGYSSIYKAYINLSDSSKHINSYRTGDIYQIYVYDATTDTYTLNPAP